MNQETGIQQAIIQYLQILENQGKLYFIRNNTGQFKGFDCQGRQKYLKFGKKGTSDLIVFLPGRTIFMEVKTEKGKMSESQVDFAEQITKLGYQYRIVRSVDEAQLIIGREV